MATGTRALTLKLLADVDNFTKNLNKADKDVMSFGDKVSDFGKKAGLAFAAAFAPAHADALNDLSSTPPVSSARHALVVAAFAAGVALNESAATAKSATNVVVFFNFPPRRDG